MGISEFVRLFDLLIYKRADRGWRGGGLYAGKKIMASETPAATNTIRQNEYPYLKKRRKYIELFIYFLIKKFISEIKPLWLKNQNQRVDKGGGGGGGNVE